MTKIRDLIEKIWWVIPPIIVVFGIPLYFTIDEMIKFSQPLSLFFWSYGKNLPLIPQISTSFGPYGGIAIIILLGFMGIGYYLVRKRTSLLLRIIVTTILGIIGFFAGLLMILILSGLSGGIQ